MIEKILILGVLYFVQGLPYGFQDKFIPMYLRSTGLSHTRLSLMKLLLLPWLCKAGFGPLIDLKWTKWLWLLLSLAALTVVSLLGTLIDTEYFAFMCVWLLLLNLFSAFQDVSVDALALHILRECEMGHGNTAQVVGYKLGSLFGGGVLFWIHHYYGWIYLCLSLSCLYILSIFACFPMYIRSKSQNLKTKVEEDRNTASLIDAVSEKLLSIGDSRENLVQRKKISNDITTNKIRMLSRRNSLAEIPYKLREIPRLILNTSGTLPAIIFLLLYKLGERGSLSTFPIFLVDQNVSTKDIGFWSGIVGQLASLLGSIFAGCLIANKIDLPLFLYYVLLARTFPIFLQWIIINLWFTGAPAFFHSILFFFSVISLCALEFIAGLVTTSIFTLMMSCSLKAPASLQATHYSVLSSVEVAGKLLFSSMAGVLIDWLGLSQVYFLFVMLTAASVLMLPFIDCIIE